MLRILVTGADGFIGKNFQDFLRANYPGAECVFAVHSKIPENPSFGEFIKADLAKEIPASLSSEKFDFVFHLAALNITNVGKAGLKELFEANAFGTLRLLESAKFENFVYFSTARTYGLPSGKKLGENAIPQPADDYTISKYVGELFCQKFSKTSNAKFFIFRSVNVYGPKQPAKALVPVFFSNALQGKDLEVFGKASVVQLIFVQDVLNAFKLVIEGKIPAGIFNIAPKKPVKLLEIAEKVKALSDSSSSIKVIDKNVMASLVSAKKLESFGWRAQTSIGQGLKSVLESMR